MDSSPRVEGGRQVVGVAMVEVYLPGSSKVGFRQLVMEEEDGLKNGNAKAASRVVGVVS